MNRSTRTLLVITIAVLLASFATYLVYRTIQNRPVREVEVSETLTVVAAHPLQVGMRVKAEDVKRIPWPTSNPVPGAFTAAEDVVDRGVIAPVAPNEPLTGNNLALKEAGAGLPPTIPEGMRAISVRVNEIIGVAGFVLPGARVDVMAILDQDTSSVARVVVSNVQVLAAGTKYDQEAAKVGTAIPTSVVTLLVNPADAELIGLAVSKGQIMLTLRNPLDTTATSSSGTRTSSLQGLPAASTPAPAAPVRERRVVSAAPPPPPTLPPPPPTKYTVEVIRAAKRTDEEVK